MVEDINKNGVLTKTKAPLNWYLTNFHTSESWMIGLPNTDKYLKYDIVKKTTIKIRLCRKIITYISPIMIISAAILLMIIE